MNQIPLILSSLCLVQCASQHVPPGRPLTAADKGKILSVRYYEINGIRKVERWIIVTTQPKLETRLETEILP
jgi:hypothetical protein